ncbi:MAG: efflux RND transporter periplasmic adaptor subunit [Verrucomicrobia bacterium]|nr:efflux RND transporter periplasmic adaptor subunit [Verrucomicrobiota bacterium]
MRRFFIIGIVLVGVIALGILLYFYRRPPEDGLLTLYGNVDVRQVDIGFRVDGRVIEMPFQEGDLVCAGKFMGKLDHQPLEDEVEKAKANVDALQASLVYSKQVLDRRQKLLDLGDGSISLENYQEAFAAYHSFLANLMAAEAALKVAEKNLQETEVFAPSPGVILTRVREPGSVVRAGDPIYTLSLTSPVWIRAFVPEPLLGAIYPGMCAEVYTDTVGQGPYKGHIGFISPVAEFTPKTVETTQLRTDLVYRLRIIADNPDQGLRQGMPVTVKLKKNE